MIPRSFVLVRWYWFSHQNNLQTWLNLCDLFAAGMVVHKFTHGFVCSDQCAFRQQCMEAKNNFP